MAGDQAGMGEGSPGGAGGWGGGFGIPATGQPDSIRPDTDRSDTARVTQGDASASDHPEDGLFGERNRLGRDAYGRRGMPGDENGDNTEEAGDALQLMPERLKQDQGETDRKGRRGRFFCFRRPAWTRKAVRVCFCRLCRNSSERQSGSGAAERAQRREWGEAFSEEMEAERVAGRCVRVLRGIECPKFYTGRPVFQGFQK